MVCSKTHFIVIFNEEVKSFIRSREKFTKMLTLIIDLMIKEPK